METRILYLQGGSSRLLSTSCLKEPVSIFVDWCDWEPVSELFFFVNAAENG